MRRALFLLIAAALLAPTQALSQTVRFQTGAGAFDMLLNPTDNPNLQSHVDNLLANVAAGVYHCSVVNRAPDGFVLQLGGLTADSVATSEVPAAGFERTDSFVPVVVDADNNGQVDFSTAGLTNTRGTVSLALAGGNANSGSASFFINIGNNSFLDAQGFVPFAQIADMSTIDRIMGLTKLDLSDAVGRDGDVTYTDVPLTDDGELVVVETASVVSQSSFSFVGPLLTANGVDVAAGIGTSAAAQSNLASLQAIVDGELGRDSDPPFALATASAPTGGAASIPEPGALLLLAGALLAAATRR